MLSQVFYLFGKLFVMYITYQTFSLVLRISAIGICTSEASFCSCLKMVLSSVIGRQGSQQQAHEQHIQLFMQEIMTTRIALIIMLPIVNGIKIQKYPDFLSATEIFR